MKLRTMLAGAVIAALAAPTAAMAQTPDVDWVDPARLLRSVPGSTPVRS